MLNYTEYHIMGKIAQVRMKPDCIPSKFGCQEDRRKRTCSSTERSYLQTIEEPEMPCPLKMDKSLQVEISCAQKNDNSIQATMTPKFRSKAIQSKIKTLNQASSPLKPSITSSSTSPFKDKTIQKLCTSVSNINKVTRNILIEEEQSDNDIYVPPMASYSSSSSVHSLQLKSSSDCSELIIEDKKLEAEKALTNTTKKIEKNPRFYLGVPKQWLFFD
ncbi:hypothetical protein ACJJTC_004012 [Scirpophaga incertulas]